MIRRLDLCDKLEIAGQEEDSLFEEGKLGES
jgi:hypothetical protein